MDKETIKEWKKKQKATDPLKFKEMYEEYGKLQKETNSKQKTIQSYSSRIKKLDEKINERIQEISKANAELNEIQSKMEEKKAKAAETAAAGEEDFTKGLVYRVEVGAMREKSKHLEQYQIGNFWSTAQDGKKRYTLAHFRDYFEAEAFKNHIRSLGINDAYIYAYRDNKLEAIDNVQPAEENASETQQDDAASEGDWGDGEVPKEEEKEEDK